MEEELKNVVTVDALRKSFGKQEVLRDVSLSLHAKENLVVLGKSGTGKSVLIKCIVGLMKPDDGSVEVMGYDIPNLPVHELNEVRKKIGFLFQGSALYDSMSVRQNLEFPLRRVRKEKNKKVIDQKVEEVLMNVSLAEAIDKMPSQLSGGMRKRIGLARTLIMDPEIILYDEPTTGLDPVTSIEICELINQVQQKYHSASIIITHDLNVVKLTSNRVLVLRDGIIYAEGTFKELRQSDDELIHSFLN